MERVERRTEGGYLVVYVYKILNNEEILFLKFCSTYKIIKLISKTIEYNFEIEAGLASGSLGSTTSAEIMINKKNKRPVFRSTGPVCVTFLLIDYFLYLSLDRK